MFRDAHQAIVYKTDGSLGALIMGADGLSVDTLFSTEGGEAHLDVAAAEFTSVVRRAIKVQEMVIKLEKVTFVLRFLTRDYFVLLALTSDGNVGRGRYELRKAEIVLAKEFAL